MSRYLGKIEESRDVWERAIKRRENGKDWRFWNAVINWEEKYGSDLPVEPSKHQKKSHISKKFDDDTTVETGKNINDNSNKVLKRGLNNISRIRVI